MERTFSVYKNPTPFQRQTEQVLSYIYYYCVYLPLNFCLEYIYRKRK